MGDFDRSPFVPARPTMLCTAVLSCRFELRRSVSLKASNSCRDHLELTVSEGSSRMDASLCSKAGGCLVEEEHGLEGQQQFSVCPPLVFWSSSSQTRVRFDRGALSREGNRSDLEPKPGLRSPWWEGFGVHWEQPELCTALLRQFFLLLCGTRSSLDRGWVVTLSECALT